MLGKCRQWMTKLVFKSKLWTCITSSRQSAKELKDMYLAQAGHNLYYSLDIETRLSYYVIKLSI